MSALQKNYCTPRGECTCQNHQQELACTHRDRSVMNGLCIYRAWYEDKCLSPFAMEAARKEGA